MPIYEDERGQVGVQIPYVLVKLIRSSAMPIIRGHFAWCCTLESRIAGQVLQVSRTYMAMHPMCLDTSRLEYPKLRFYTRLRFYMTK